MPDTSDTDKNAATEPAGEPEAAQSPTAAATPTTPAGAEGTSSEASAATPTGSEGGEDDAGGGGKRLRKAKGLILGSFNLRTWRKGRDGSGGGTSPRPDGASEDGAESERSRRHLGLFGRRARRSSSDGSGEDGGGEDGDEAEDNNSDDDEEEALVITRVPSTPEGVRWPVCGRPRSASSASCSCSGSGDVTAEGGSEEGDNQNAGEEEGREREEEEEGLDETERLRRRVVREIVETEEAYQNDLRIIVDVIVAQLRERRLLEPAEIAGLFPSVDVLRNFSALLLDKLRAGEPVGRSFERVAGFMKVYITYCVNVPKAEERLRQHAKDSGAFRAFLAELSAQPALHQLGVGDFLMKPVQRLCKYPLLLRELQRHTAPGSAEERSLANAIAELQRTLAAVNESKRADEGAQRLMAVLARLDGCDDPAQLVAPTRRLVHEESLRELAPGGVLHETHYIFFTDLVLRCRAHAGRLALRSLIPRAVLLAAPVARALAEQRLAAAALLGAQPPCLIEVVHVGVDKFTVVCASEADRTRLLRLFGAAMGDPSLADAGDSTVPQQQQEQQQGQHKKSAQEVMDEYGLRPKRGPPPSAGTDETLAAPVVFSAVCAGSVRFVAFDRAAAPAWRDVLQRVGRKFARAGRLELRTCAGDAPGTAITGVVQLCDYVDTCSAVPQVEVVVTAG